MNSRPKMPTLIFPVLVITILAGCSGAQPGAASGGSALYIMNAGDPNPTNAEYKRLLEDRYGVEFRWGMHHVHPNEIQEHNATVESVLERKYGDGVLDKLYDEAVANVKAKRG